MNAADIAKYSGRSIDTVRYWERMGALPVSARLGVGVWKRTDIEAWFESKFAA